MNAPAEAMQARMAAGADFTPYEKMRLTLAARIAGGIVANPHGLTGQDAEGSAARCAMRIADKLLRLHIAGGC